MNSLGFFSYFPHFLRINFFRNAFVIEAHVSQLLPHDNIIISGFRKRNRKWHANLEIQPHWIHMNAGCNPSPLSLFTPSVSLSCYFHPLTNLIINFGKNIQFSESRQSHLRRPKIMWSWAQRCFMMRLTPHCLPICFLVISRLIFLNKAQRHISVKLSRRK